MLRASATPAGIWFAFPRFKCQVMGSIKLLRLIVVVSESARFKPIYETVEQCLKDQALMTDKEARHRP